MNIENSICCGIILAHEDLLSNFFIDFQCELTCRALAEEDDVNDVELGIILRLTSQTHESCLDVHTQNVDPQQLCVTTFSSPDVVVTPAQRAVLLAAHAKIVKPECAIIEPLVSWMNILTINVDLLKYRGLVRTKFTDDGFDVEQIQLDHWTAQTHATFSCVNEAFAWLLMSICRLARRGDVVCVDSAVVEEMLGHFQREWLLRPRRRYR